MNPPAFQFYADDFLAGTIDMSQDEVGAYIRLLAHQWNRGSIPVEPERQQRLAGGSVSVHVISKFVRGHDGLLRNSRLEREREKMDHYREKQREKGRKSGISRNSARTAVQPRLNRGSTDQPTAVEPQGEPETNLPSPSPKETYIQSEVSVARAPDPWPTIDEVKTEGQLRGISQRVAEDFWAHYEARGWKDGTGVAIVKWRPKLTTWATKERQRTNENNGRPGKQRGDAGARISNPSRAAEYANVGKVGKV